jgi:hypothetical protein
VITDGPISSQVNMYNLLYSLRITQINSEYIKEYYIYNIARNSERIGEREKIRKIKSSFYILHVLGTNIAVSDCNNRLCGLGTRLGCRGQVAWRSFEFSECLRSSSCRRWLMWAGAALVLRLSDTRPFAHWNLLCKAVLYY